MVGSRSSERQDEVALQAMEKLPELKAAMVRYWEAHAGEAGEGLEVLPGVVELLKSLKVCRALPHAVGCTMHA